MGLKCNKWNGDLVLSETSELGFDPVADPDQVERERWLSPAIRVLLWSIFPFHSLLCFYHQDYRKSWGVCSICWGDEFAHIFLVQMCEILHMVESILQRFVLVLWLIQRDVLCSAATFYNTSSLKKSRTALEYCVHGSVCVPTCVFICCQLCVFIWSRISIMNSELQGDMAASFWMTRIGWTSDGHALIDLSFTLNVF